jgi:hypothetical protein
LLPRRHRARERDGCPAATQQQPNNERQNIVQVFCSSCQGAGNDKNGKRRQVIGQRVVQSNGNARHQCSGTPKHWMLNNHRASELMYFNRKGKKKVVNKKMRE